MQHQACGGSSGRLCNATGTTTRTIHSMLQQPCRSAGMRPRDRPQQARRQRCQSHAHHANAAAAPAATASSSSSSDHSSSSSHPAAPSTPGGATTAELTALAAHTLRHGNGLAKRMLADPRLEGDPLAFLRQTEAFWAALKQQADKPQRPPPAVITTSSAPMRSILPPPPSPALPPAAAAASDAAAAATTPSSSQQWAVPPSFGAAPRPDASSSKAAAAAAAAQAAAAAPVAAAAAAAQPDHDFDVVMAGGTLGLAVALALQQQGYRVAVVERRRVEGRLQEWNSSRAEVAVLVAMGLLSAAELEACIPTEFNPVRVSFAGQPSRLAVRDVLNIGVSPQALIARLRARFEVAGGVLYEHTAFKSAVVAPDGVVVRLASAAQQPADVGDTNRPNALQGNDDELRRLRSPFGHVAGSSGSSTTSSSDDDSSSSMRAAASPDHASSSQQQRPRAPKQLTCRLLLDAMGHYSPVVKQLRAGARPDGMVLVVGGCATGFAPEANTSADLLHSFTDATADMQLFFEAFPAQGGAARTTYCFAYTDAHPSRPSFERLLDTYFTLLPSYQGLPSLAPLQFQRVLFGGFPCFSGSSPLRPGWDRVLQLGDAAAGQSPLSFGGFGAMLRHLPRLSRGLAHALADDRLARGDLAWINGYQPALSAAWLFQRAMSLRVGQQQQPQQPPAQLPQPATTHATASSSSSSSNPSEQQQTAPRPRWPARLAQLPGDHINALLGANFAVLGVLGERCLRPFLQDVLQLGPLALAMAGMMLARPLVIARVVLQVGPAVLGGWFCHFAALAAYTAAFHVLRPLRRLLARSYTFQRLLDALAYGSGSDYRYERPSSAAAEADAAPAAATTEAAAASSLAPQQHQQQPVPANNVVAAPVRQQQQQPVQAQQAYAA